jgi:hypothetical protein
VYLDVSWVATEHVFDRGAIVVGMTTAVRIDDEVVQPRGQVSASALKAWDQYLGRCDDLKATAGVLNTAHAHLVEVAVSCLEEGDHLGPGLHSFPQFLAWQTGVSTATAKAVDGVARRVGELPSLWAALRAGEISLDQAAVVAKYAPPELDGSATQLARVATVSQLKTLLRPFGPDQKKGPGRGSHVSVNDLDDGCARIVGDLDADEAALVRKALDAMREDLFRQRRADAKAAAEETGDPLREVEAPTGAEALAALAETALRAQEAEHPGSERYLISYHLQARADGKLLLLDDRSVPVPEYERRRVLCDHRFETILHDHNATPLSVGRATRHIGRKLRRAILHRHRHTCAVPGCDTRHGLEIHHIVHWEDGGPTDTPNLTSPRAALYPMPHISGVRGHVRQGGRRPTTLTRHHLVRLSSLLHQCGSTRISKWSMLPSPSSLRIDTTETVRSVSTETAVTCVLVASSPAGSCGVLFASSAGVARRTAHCSATSS